MTTLEEEASEERQERPEAIKIAGTVDTWNRKPNFRKSSFGYEGLLGNTLRVAYKDGRVIQIEISLTGYSLNNGLSIESTFADFEKKLGKNYRDYSFDYDADRQAGMSHWMCSFWDYESIGLTIESYHSGGDSPSQTQSISIHKPGARYMFTSPA